MNVTITAVIGKLTKNPYYQKSSTDNKIIEISKTSVDSL